MQFDFLNHNNFKNLLEKSSEKTDTTRVIFVDNNSEFSKVFHTFPTQKDLKFFFIQNVYNSENAHPLLHAKKSNFYQLDRFAHLAQNDLFKNLNLIFPISKQKVSLFENFESEELQFWKSVRLLEAPVKFSGYKIIPGKKIGRTLGIPTGFFISEYLCWKNSLVWFFYASWRLLRTHEIQLYFEPSSKSRSGFFLPCHF